VLAKFVLECNQVLVAAACAWRRGALVWVCVDTVVALPCSYSCLLLISLHPLIATAGSTRPWPPSPVPPPPPLLTATQACKLCNDYAAFQDVGARLLLTS
jgi:hypothetical protein